MSMIVVWLETYWRELLFGLFWLMQGIILITLIVTAHRASVIRKKINRMCTRVEEYVDAVMQEDKPVPERRQIVQTVDNERSRRSEEESQIVSAVLKEIFP